jgi:hypothetical protein
MLTCDGIWKVKPVLVIRPVERHMGGILLRPKESTDFLRLHSSQLREHRGARGDDNAPFPQISHSEASLEMLVGG